MGRERSAGQGGVDGDGSGERLCCESIKQRGNFGRLGAAQQRGSHSCTPQERSETLKQRNVARRTTRSQRRVQLRPVTPRVMDASKDFGPERPAGQRGVAGGESGKRFANRARDAGSFGRPSAAQQRGPHRGTAQDQSETRLQRDVARCAARSQSRALQQHVSDGRKRKSTNKTNAHTTTEWCESGRPGSEALPAEHREDGFRNGQAARAALDPAARRNTAGRVCARRKTGVRHASSEMWQNAR